MNRIFILLIFITTLLKCQEVDAQSGGVIWTEGLTWEQVLSKAKKEGKNIFVDCYTTWCGPCKAMEKNVYPDEKVGKAINNKFIAIKVQMDKTDKDNETIKSWYEDAIGLGSMYKVNAYPTLLFFSQDGSIVHKVSQGLNVDGFLEVVATALDPKKRYYSWLAEYQMSGKDTSMMRDLVKVARAADDSKMAEQIAEDYIGTLNLKSLTNPEIMRFIKENSRGENAYKLANKYINHLKKKEVFIKENIEFIRQFTKSTMDRGFKIFYNSSEKVNHLMDGVPIPKGAISSIQGDYAQSTMRSIIYNEKFYKDILRPSIDSGWTNRVLDWSKIRSKWEEKFSKLGSHNIERVLTDAQINWYGWQKEWTDYGNGILHKLDLLYSDKSLAGAGYFVNNSCWAIFLKNSDTVMINKAIHWMERLFKENPGDLKWSTGLDTYANLLYKTGRTKEAIEWETKAVKENTDPTDTEFINTLAKMKQGIPTWPQH